MSTQGLPPHRCPSSTFDLKARTSLRFKKVGYLTLKHRFWPPQNVQLSVQHIQQVSFFHLFIISFWDMGGLLNSRLPKDDIRTQSEYLIWATEGHSTSDLVAQWPEWVISENKHSSKNVGTLHILTGCSDLQTILISVSMNPMRRTVDSGIFYTYVFVSLFFFNIGHFKFDACNTVCVYESWTELCYLLGCYNIM